MSGEKRVGLWMAIIGIVGWLAFFWVAGAFKAESAAYTYRLNFPVDAGYDSVRVRWWIATTKQDSFTVATFPFDTNLALDDTYPYKVEFLWFGADTVLTDLNLPGSTAPTAWHGTFYAAGCDSVKVFPYADYTTLGSPAKISAFPKDTNFSLSGSDPYKLEFLWFAGVDTLYGDASVFGAMTASSGGGGCGDGPYAVKIYALDTSGTDSTVSGVLLGVTNIATGDKLMGPTLGDGGQTFGLAAATYQIIGYKTNYWFAIDTIVVSANNDSVALPGYDLASTYGSTPQVCVVTVNVKLGSGAPASGVNVSAYIRENRVTDSSGAVIIPRAQNEPTDSLGQAVFQCIWSSYLIPETKWRFTATLPSGSKSVDVLIPRQATYTVDFSE